jgi:hypothetical protein
MLPSMSLHSEWVTDTRSKRVLRREKFIVTSFGIILKRFDIVLGALWLSTVAP